MGLFDKKFCDICGEKISLLGNRKLEDGNCCKDCAKKLSPWFDERRHSTVAQIKEQLAYREANKQAVAAFHATRTYGESTTLCIDESGRRFMVARTDNYAVENPDVIDFSQVINCTLDAKESRSELKQKDAQGNEVSFNPPRYEYEYDFYIVIHVNSPWFDTIRFQLNRDELILQDMTISRGGILRQTFDPHKSVEYQRYEAMGREISDILLGGSLSDAGQGSEPVVIGDLRQAGIDPALIEQFQAVLAAKEAGSPEYSTADLMGKQAVAMTKAGGLEQAQQLLSAFIVKQQGDVMPAGLWTCQACEGQNNSTAKFCEFCGAARQK